MATTPKGSEHTAGSQSTSETTDALRSKAAELGSEVRHEAAKRAEEAQHRTSESLHSFAEAIRKAGDELKKKDEGPAARLLGEAAGGLEQLSAALGQKRLEDIVNDVRHFGRQNPGAFMAGSMLLGMALGRFARSGFGSGATGSTGADTTRGRSTYPTGTAQREPGSERGGGR